MSQDVTLSVTGMTCGGCENAVQRAVGQLPGVSRVVASHRERTVTVTFDPSATSRADIERKIGQVGYTVNAA